MVCQCARPLQMATLNVESNQDRQKRPSHQCYTARHSWHLISGDRHSMGTSGQEGAFRSVVQVMESVERSYGEVSRFPRGPCPYHPVLVLAARSP